MKQQLETEIRNAFQVAVAKQNGVEIISNTEDDFGLDTKREMLKKTIGDYVQETENHLAKLKISLNALVAINRLPIDLLTRIILLATSSNKLKEKHPYISYTWVCRHWRYVIIQCPNFWTSIQLKPNSEGNPISPFVRELLGRSKDAKLDIRLTINSTSYLSILRDFFAEEGIRIRTLWLHATNLPIVKSVFSDRQFPSIQRVIHRCHVVGPNFIHDLLPYFVASENLKTLDCDLYHVDEVHQLKPVFNCLRALSLSTIQSQTALQFVLDSLHNNTRLLRLSLDLIFHPFNLSSQTTLPELRYLHVGNVELLRVIRAPKLSSLDVRCYSTLTFDETILEGFNLPSIKYLHILKRNEYFILGLKGPIHPMSVFSRPGDFLDRFQFVEEVQDIADSYASKDVPIDAWRPDFLRLMFGYEILSRSLKGSFSSFFPRLTGLSELCLMADNIAEREACFSEILTRVPSLETLVILYGRGLMDAVRLLSNTSLCPQLKHLSYVTSYPYYSVQEEDKLKIAEKVGRLLTECIQLRQEAHSSNRLNYIAFGNSPPLPDSWLKELQKLGTTVLTEENVELKRWASIVSTLESRAFLGVSELSKSLDE